MIAKAYGVCNANSAILFEDLTSKEYRILSVYRGFNFEEAKIVLEKAATMHAIHAVLQEEQPNIFEHFKYGRIQFSLISHKFKKFSTKLFFLMNILSS